MAESTGIQRRGKRTCENAFAPLYEDHIKNQKQKKQKQDLENSTPVISSASSSVASDISTLEQSTDPDNCKHLDLNSTNRLIKDRTGGGGGIRENLEDRFRQTVEHSEGLANMNSMMTKSGSDIEVADSVDIFKMFGFSCPDEIYDACQEAVKGAKMLQEGNKLLIEGRNVLMSAIAKLTNRKHD